MKIETKFNIAAAAMAVAVVILALCASAVTADWDAVKRLVGDATNDTLRAANAYADQHGGGGSGGGADAGTVAALVTATQNLTVAVSGLQSSKLNGPTDANLEISGKAADAAEVGQRISSVQNAMDNMLPVVYQASMDVANANQSVFEMGMRVGQLEFDVSEKADASDLAPLASDIRAAYQYSRAVSLYMAGSTNAWFAGTNYVFGADAATRQHFAWEPGMDAATVPCSMALWENRDGVKQCVWDQRDWTAWYWSFKAGQMRSEIAATNKAIYAAIASDENHAWAKRYASSGRVNPDPTTTFIDTQSVCLSPGMNWETVATVGGCGYWTIVGDGAVIGGSDTNAVLEIKDFEGNSIMRIAKGEHRLAWLSSADFVGQMTDADGWVCFDMRADVQPVGYFSATLEAADFVAETDANCPAMYRWENRGGGVWRVHFLLKSGIVSSSCFAKFIVEVQGKTQIRYEADVVVGGALIFNGVKIAPVIPAGAAVGSTVTWKVVQ